MTLEQALTDWAMRKGIDPIMVLRVRVARGSARELRRVHARHQARDRRGRFVRETHALECMCIRHLG